MAASPNALLDRLTRGKADKLLRFSAVSVVGVVMTQILLVVGHGIMGIDAVWANLLAVSISAAPVFILNKRWVWGKEGKSHWRRELLPFWAFTLLGLALSTGLVALATHIDDTTILVMLANISGFGVVWLAKFFFLDSVLWGSEAEPA